MNARNINIYNPDNTGNMGRYYFTLGQILNPSYYEKAIDYFEKVIQLAPQNVQYYNLLAQVHYIMGDYDESLNWLNKSVELDDRYFPTWLQLGDTYAAKANVDAALEAHTQAILLDPGSFADNNFDNRLNFYISGNRAEDLIAVFERYIEENPKAASQIRYVLWAIGHTYLRAGDLTQASIYIQQAIDQGYDNARATTELADAYLANEKFQEAEVAYQKALNHKNANQAQIYSSLGYIYARTGRLQEAIEANQKVLEARPNDYDSNKNLALLYQQAGQIDQALIHAQAALEVAPENSKADLTAYINQLQAAQAQTP
jgi:tetratricopeptide (TPR) repeat protein